MCLCHTICKFVFNDKLWKLLLKLVVIFNLDAYIFENCKQKNKWESITIPTGLRARLCCQLQSARRSTEAKSDLSSIPPAPALVTGPQGLDLDKTLSSPSGHKPKPQTIRLPVPWGGQRCKRCWLVEGLSNLEAKVFFPYIIIIKYNYCCYWIFILTTRSRHLH